VSSDPDLIYARQMRSAQKNSQYYNPAITYRPWLKSDGTRFTAYPANNAPVDPRLLVERINLISSQKFDEPFCKSRFNCKDIKSKETFYPAQYYTLTSGTGESDITNFTRFVLDVTFSPGPKPSSRTDCLLAVCTLVEEQQNFSNWFTYYRSRLLAAIGGTASAFQDLPNNYRLGYGQINQASHNVDGVKTETIVRGLRPYSGTGREEFYTWLLNIQVDDGSTPLRRAMGDVGEYFMRTDNAGPWGSVPGTSDATAHLTCRRSYHLLITDGAWNGDSATNSKATGNVDNSTMYLRNTSVKTYTPSFPFKDDNDGTLADVALYYWGTDLRPDLNDDVKPSAADPAFWQHMVNYTIGFGVNGNLNNPGDLPALRRDPGVTAKDWGNPKSGINDKIDDLWHAALNSRGLSISAANPEEYSNAVKSIITNIEERNGSDAGVAVSGKRLTSSSRKYVPEYRSLAWTGELTATALDASGVAGSVVWRASENLPSAATRNIFTYKDATTRGVPFTLAGMTAASMITALNVTTSEVPSLINYLRGDSFGEGSVYRIRTKKLGDIVNSAPILVKDLLDSQYDFLATGTAGKASYREFLRNKKSRIGQVFVGANDGMLHAFNDVNGTETFAFMPRTVLADVKVLSQTPYDHRYFVDGPVIEADIFDATAVPSGAWKNLVLATGGAGAKNLFAINVPVPASLSGGGAPAVSLSAPGSSDVLWEISNSGDFAELGNILRAPEVGIMRNGQWAVIVGNGYASASGKAQLFVINALTGALIKKIDTGVPLLGGGNGLGGVRVVRDIQQRIVSAYAGDLRGNVWKFDFSGTTSASWGVAFGSTALTPRPLFTALNSSGQAEPITTSPTYVLHPSGGVQVLVGTGKLFETADTNNIQERTLYGLWDKIKVGLNSGDITAAISGTAQLVGQQVSGTVSITSGTPALTTVYWKATNNLVDYSTKRGWRLPLSIQPGQRLIYDPQVSLGRAFFETVVPGGAVLSCDASSGTGYNFILDPLTGAAGTDGPTFDTNGDGVINAGDSATAVIYKTAADGGDGILITGGARQTGVIVSTTSSRLFAGDPNSVRRSWRQLFNPPN
jgi:type IV pilus assembly protein PilY1